MPHCQVCSCGKVREQERTCVGPIDVNDRFGHFVDIKHFTFAVIVCGVICEDRLEMVQVFYEAGGSELLCSAQRFCLLVPIVEVDGNWVVYVMDLKAWFYELHTRKESCEIKKTDLNHHVQYGHKELRIFGTQESLLFLVEIYVILCVPSQAEFWRQITDDGPRLAEPFSVWEFQGRWPEVLGNTDYVWVGNSCHQGRVVFILLVGGSAVLKNESDIFSTSRNTIPLGSRGAGGGDRSIRQIKSRRRNNSGSEHVRSEGHMIQSFVAFQGDRSRFLPLESTWLFTRDVSM